MVFNFTVNNFLCTVIKFFLIHSLNNDNNINYNVYDCGNSRRRHIPVLRCVVSYFETVDIILWHPSLNFKKNIPTAKNNTICLKD